MICDAFLNQPPLQTPVLPTLRRWLLISPCHALVPGSVLPTSLPCSTVNFWKPSELQSSFPLLQFGVSCITLPNVTTSCSNQKPSDIWSLDSGVSGARFLPQTYLSVCKNSPALISLINPLPQLCCSLRERWRQFNPLLNGPPMIYAEDCKWSDSILKSSQNLLPTTYRTNSPTLSPFLFAVKNMNSWIWKKKSKQTFGIFTGTDPERVS